MLVRIVKMSFNPNDIDAFLIIFNRVKQKVKATPGCELLELYQDKNQKNIFFTYSYWQSEKDLNNYRKSELFMEVWSKTRALFNAKPEAWSVDKIVSLQD